jgi:DNA primase
MVIFTKDSLDTLKNKIDLVEALSPYVEFKRAGASFKALCPFHDEKSPSFMIQKGDTHYHCFGCGAHGDAIAFLMDLQKLNFREAVELLAEKFQVHLEKTESEEEKGPSKKAMREALDFASKIFHTLLLNTAEGHQALRYLMKRGITLEFVRKFGIGYAPQASGILAPMLAAKCVSSEIAQACGLLTPKGDFFRDRIVFPIRAATGHVIGFSGRKFKEETFGGKYVNTPETPLFKKSRVLFGLNYSRQRIAKERIALVVEGQIDALRLIDEGLDFTVAGQGTAFGEGHVDELANLGVLTVYLALDADLAGKKAAIKIGDLFQKRGIEVKIVPLPEDYDPDLYVKEKGAEAFLSLMKEAEDYLSFLVKTHELDRDLSSPAVKNDLALELGKQIRAWDAPLMVHESLKKLSKLLQVPETLVGVGQLETAPLYYKKSASVGLYEIDPDWVIETDVLIWLLYTTPEIDAFIDKHLTIASFTLPISQKAFQHYLDKKLEGKKPDLLALCQLEEGTGQKLVEEMTSKKINREKPDLYFKAALQKLLDRNWLTKREEVWAKIQRGASSIDEEIALAKQFEEVKKCRPQL